jgi:phosphate-selective porin
MNFKRNVILTAIGAALALTNTTLKAQEIAESPLDTITRTVQSMADDLNKMKRLKITGYIQPQYQYIDSAGAPSFAGGDFINGTNPYFSRFTMRRGRFKFTYDYQNVKLVINTDATEKGLFMRETFVKVTDPWLHIFSVTGGLLQDQFGFELTQSSSERETPERARYNQILFPTERDLGVFGTMEFPKTSPLYGLKMDVAVMNGSGGVTPEFDSHKDFTGRLQYKKTTKSEKVEFGAGVSYYSGGYRIGSNKDYVYNDSLANGEKGFEFAGDTANYNRVAKREYMGVDAQVSIDWKIGITVLRGEYIMGEQPGTSSASKSPTGAPTAALYHRQFNGAYFYLIQNIGTSKFQVVAKYDWYDPNVKIAGKEIGKAATNTKAADIRFDTYGFGVTYRMNTYVKIIAYYDLVKNESTLVTGYTGDIKDNVFTLRMQCKF